MPRARAELQRRFAKVSGRKKGVSSTDGLYYYVLRVPSNGVRLMEFDTLLQISLVVETLFL